MRLLLALAVLVIIAICDSAYGATNQVITCPTCTPGAAVRSADPYTWQPGANGVKVLIANTATTTDYYQATWQLWESTEDSSRLWRCTRDIPVGSTVDCGGNEGFALKSSLVPPGPPPPPAYTEPRTFSWDAPTINADGSPLTDLAGYRLARGRTPNVYTENILLGLLTTHTFPALEEGQHCAGVYARDDDGNESARSPELCITITKPVDPPPTCPPPQPADDTQTVQCTAPQVGSWTQARPYSCPTPPAWTAGPWTPATAPPGVCVTPPPTALKVMAVVPELSHAPVFGIGASGTRGTAVLGFVPVGTACSGAVVYRYRSQDYYRVAAGTTVWWASAPTANAAVACRVQ